jgi:hypothetical protein
MKIKAGGLAAIIGILGLCFALPVFGQSDGSSFTVTFSAATNPVIVGDGYADPYNGSVAYNGSSVNPNNLIVCDDYKDTVNAGKSWPATGMEASTLNSTNIMGTMFGSKIGLIGYAEVADLVSQMFGTTNHQQQADLSAALWWITSGGTVTKNGMYTFAGVTLDANAAALLSAVLKTSSSTLLAALAKDTSLWILTPTGNGTNGQQPQEMWATLSTPEGGAAFMFLLLAGASCFGAMFFKYRSRLGSGETA